MSQPKTQSDRVFLRPQYSLHFRRTRQVRLVNEARADYVSLFQFSGGLRCTIGEEVFELGKGGALLLDPGKGLSAGGRNAELLMLTISPSFVLDCAARTGLVGAGATVSFRSSVVEKDSRLSRLARDLADELTQEEA
ncbi:MAG: hypothetical protein M3362_17630, partial [Acidobacteriota bacterium]|nr:hypothetical protein [Acidobacteriota bacterium]